ncbi:hypothetical protein PSTT_10036, partial [Puccinia striiformis]
WIATHAVFGGVRTRYTQLALLITNENQEPTTQTLHGQLSISIKMSASDSAPKQETSDPTPPSLPATNATIPPHVLMQIAQLLAAQNIPIPSVPPPVTSAPIKPLAPSPSEPHLGNDLADEPLNNNDDLAKEPLNNNDEAPGKDLAEEPLNNDDEVSLASLDDQVHTKTSEVASPPSRLTSHQSTSTEPVELVTSVNDFDYQIG